MLISNFKDLFVWQKAHTLVLEIYQKTKQFPNEETYGLSAQIRRSAVSVCANIAEGHKKKTLDYARFLQIAQASLEETCYHILLSKDLGYIDQEEYGALTCKADEVGRMLTGLRRKIRSKR